MSTVPDRQDTTAQLRRALAALKEMRAKLEAAERSRREPIAIIGMGCRFPGGVDSPAAFWHLLQNGIDAISEVPANRWDANAFYDPDVGTPGKMDTRWGGFLNGIALFDPGFFGISPREAVQTDPQQRILLEVAYEALEEAGQTLAGLAGSQTGVFVGIHSYSNDYTWLQIRDRENIDTYTGTGTAHSITANRISYLFDLRGPSMALDTACSSGLVAVHFACQSLRTQDCDLALAGGVNLMLSPEATITFSKLQMMAADGRCKTFDAHADGFVRGEGCGLVVLKRLSDALADRDPILAIIQGSAVNQDGHTNGLTAPNGLAQVAVIRQALANAQVEPGQITYVETHGTGTALGDPIEVEALVKVLGNGDPVADPCFLGSVKANIGHLEGAAGIAGLIKAVLALQHGSIPPQLHFQQLNPHISLSNTRFAIPVQEQPWPQSDKPRHAAVSSFGFGGTNGHMILREAPPPQTQPHEAASLAGQACILPLSAQAPQALRDLAGRYQQLLASTDLPLSALCAAASLRRSHLERRLALVGRSKAEMVERLQQFVRGETDAGILYSERSPDEQQGLVFVFSGQGPQRPGMGQEIAATEPVFRTVLEECDELLRRQGADWSLLAELAADSAHSRLNETQVAQPAIFALQVALAALWRSWGIEPDAVVGHSVGEVAAAHVAGVFTLPEAIRIVFHRGRIMQQATGLGKMAAIGLSQAETETLLANYTDRLSIAATNSPVSTVISGEAAALEEVLQAARARGAFVRMLAVDYAFHSPQMEPFQHELVQALSGLSPAPAALPLYSTVTGKRAQPGDFDGSYWGRNVREPVAFASAMAALEADGNSTYVEISPHPVLTVPLSQCLRAEDEATVIPSLARNQGERTTLLRSLGTLYTQNYSVNWHNLYRDGGQPVQLPTYPWQRKSYWFNPPTSARGRATVSTPDQVGGASPHPLLGYQLRSAGREIIFETRLGLESHPFLADHRVQGTAIVPATAYVEMALAAAGEAFGGTTAKLEDVLIHRALVLSDGDPTQLMQVVLTPQEDRTATFQIFSFQPESMAGAKGTWTLHAAGKVSTALVDTFASLPLTLEQAREVCQEAIPFHSLYGLLSAFGLEYGVAFQGVEEMWVNAGTGEAIGRISLPKTLVAEAEDYWIHPALLDACMQLVGALLPDAGNRDETYLPISLDRFILDGRPGVQLWSQVSRRSENGAHAEAVVTDIRLFDEQGKLVGEVTGLTLKRTRRQNVLAARLDHLNDWLYEVVWRAKPLSNAIMEGHLVSPRQVAEQLQPHLAQLGAEEKTEVFQRALPHLEALSTAYIVQAFEQLGWTLQVGQWVSAHSLAQDLGVAIQHRRLLVRLLQILQEDGLLKQVGDEWEVRRRPDPMDPETQLSDLLDQYPACRTELTMIGRIGRQFAAALRGDADPLELIFPDGSLDDAEMLYQSSPLIYGFNILAQKAIAAALAHIPENRPIRILEIGGGTGGTTAHVLPGLNPEQTEYVFTDISPLFTSKVQQKFQSYPFVRYQTLDIERDPGAQGFESHQFDLIVAANVLHATADLRRTLRNVQKLLAPHGLLVLVEGTGPQRFVDILVGLTEGWWKFEDTDLRPAYPLISKDQWLALLPEAGFIEAAALSGETTMSHQALLLAQGSPLAQDGGEQVTAKRAGKWLLFADEGGMARQLAARLQASGQDAVFVYKGTQFEALQSDEYRVNPAERVDFEQLFARLRTDEQLLLQGIIHLWALDRPVSHATSLPATQLAEMQLELCGGVLYLVQALAAVGDVAFPGLWLVTRGAQPAGAADEVALPGVGQATLWGLGKVIAQEHPELNCVRIDLDPAGTADEIDALLQTIQIRDAEDQIALRRNQRYVPRLVSGTSKRHARENQPQIRDGQPFQLVSSRSGMVDGLEFQSLLRRTPGPGEVEIEVHAAGLGFRDVLLTLGMIPQDTGPLGAECAGRIVAKGADVDQFQVGDEVIAIALGSYRSHVTLPMEFVAHKPDRFSLVEAATIPSAFLTAYYTLHRLAGISAGDRVLIHAAAGGVGLAAVQLAQRAGAEIYGTAGSQAKRAFLKALGVQHVMDSRSLQFAEEIMALTGGEGVDIVLNSLADEFIPKSLSVLAEDGYFLEIGKRDVWDPEQVRRRKPQARYTVADLVTVAQQEPALIAAMLRDLVAAFNEGALHPLPLRVFARENVVDSFRYMAQARHIGKIIVTLQPQKGQVASLTIHPDATYLITGGLGGIGLVVARWLVDQGARHLVLVGRNAPSDGARRTLSELEQSGAQIVVAQADVSQLDELREVFAQIERSAPPLRGVIHSAGVLDDGVLLQQNWSRFARVFAPKVEGGWNLHHLTRDLSLDFFVLFSSAVSLLGSAGQPNHVAACTFLDILAHYRRTQGLPALSVDWGPWAEVGAAAQGDIEARFSTRGVGSITPQQGVQALARVMQQSAGRVADLAQTQVGVMPVDWPKFTEQFPFTASISPFFSEVAHAPPASETRSDGKGKAADAAPNFLQRLMKAPPGQRDSLLQDYVQEQSLKVLGLEPTYLLDRRKPLQELGLDSLMAVELRNRLGNGLNLKRALPATLIFSHPTVEALASYFTEQLFLPRSDEDGGAPETGLVDQVDPGKIALAALEQLSDEEAEAMLLAQLQKARDEDGR